MQMHLLFTFFTCIFYIIEKYLNLLLSTLLMLLAAVGVNAAAVLGPSGN